MNKATSHFNHQNIRYSDYRTYDRKKFYLHKVYGLIIKFDRKHNFKKSLDVGCADGSFSFKLKQDLGLDVYGLDISEKAIELAIQSGVKAKVHNVENSFPFEKESFDLVLACEIIEHIYHTDFFLEEAKRVLKKNGILILSTPNLVSLYNRIKMLFGKYPSFVPEYHTSEGTSGHIRAYTLPTLSKQL